MEQLTLEQRLTRVFKNEPERSYEQDGAILASAAKRWWGDMAESVLLAALKNLQCKD